MSTKIKNERDGWICSNGKKATLWKKTQKLGHIGEMLRMSWEIYEQWASDGFSMDVL